MPTWSNLNNNSKACVYKQLGGIGTATFAQVSRKNRNNPAIQTKLKIINMKTQQYAKTRLKELLSDVARLRQRIRLSENQMRNLQSNRRALMRAASKNNANINLRLYDPDGNTNKAMLENYLQNHINREKNEISRLRKDLHLAQGRQKRLRKASQKASYDIHKTLMIKGPRQNVTTRPSASQRRRTRTSTRR